jgi:hypothetical protein
LQRVEVGAHCRIFAEPKRELVEELRAAGLTLRGKKNAVPNSPARRSSDRNSDEHSRDG